MKNKELRYSKIKKDLHFRRKSGKKFVVWSLSKEQVEYVVSLGYNIKTELYEIVTRKFTNPNNISGILKDIHYAKRNGKDSIIRKLKKDQIKMLDKYNIHYYPIKYKIFL